ncbi:MAG: type II toxin-antitoxin system death-on-curing family toxin, partial [Alphaproteobacteria bacterium]|nr:type II toxin-antitoxin system death-on-curing family toxin [Alphaproteobacteria bacterium]
MSAHRRALEFGGRAGVLDIGLVESAIGRPYSGFYRSLPAKAAALIQSMATNHGFADGNKRTTVILLDTLLTKSGYRLRPLRGD